MVADAGRGRDDREVTDWTRLRCPIAIALSDDNGKTWPVIRLVEMGDGYIGKENDVNNHRYEYPVVMQSADGRLHIAYSYYDRRCVKYVVVTEGWIRGEKTEK